MATSRRAATAQAGQGGLHLGRLEQVAGAAHLVRDSRRGERLGHDRGLRVRPHQHRLVGPRDAGAVPVPRRSGHGTGFRRLVGQVVDGGNRAVGAMWSEPDRHVGARPQHGVGHRQDLGRGPVVVLQRHGVSTREVPVEVGQVAGVRPVPGIDGLVRVSHHAQVGLGTEPRGEQVELQRVDVLELVDEQVAEPPVAGTCVDRICRPGPGLRGRADRRSPPDVVASSRRCIGRRRRPPSRAAAVDAVGPRSPAVRSRPEGCDGPRPTRSRPRRRAASCDRDSTSTWPRNRPCGRASPAAERRVPPTAGAAGHRRWRGTCRRGHRRAGRDARGGPASRRRPCA